MYYPPVGFHFSVKIEVDDQVNIDQRFQDVSGLSQEISTEDLIEGGENRLTYKLPQRVAYQNIVLKRGMLTDSKIRTWIINAVENFSFKPANITITLLNVQHKPLAAWYVVGAYPVKWSVSNFNAEENKLVIETIELKYQYFKTVDVKNAG